MTPHQLPRFRMDRQGVLDVEDIRSTEGPTKLYEPYIQVSQNFPFHFESNPWLPYRQLAFGHKRFSTPFLALVDATSHLKAIDIEFSYRGHEIIDVDWKLRCTHRFPVLKFAFPHMNT